MSTFNTIALEYDDWYKRPLGTFVDEVENELVFRNIEIESGMKVLDVGCGTGLYSKRLYERGCKVTGIDIAGKMLAIARRKVPEARFLNASVDALPFPSAYFDLVFSMATIEFIEDINAAYLEMKRVAKPGAQIFIGTINADSSWGELYKADQQKVNSVFNESFFKTHLDLSAIDSDCLIKTDSCVFFSPQTSENRLNWQTEKELSLIAEPGFIAATWKKKV